MSLRGKIDFAEITDTGRVRDHNEDAIGSDPDIGLMVLADGMGGYNAGEVASGIAVQIVSELATEGAARENRDEIDPHSGLMRQSIVLRDAVYRANKIIFQTAQSQTHCEGMGTTIVACMFYDNKVSVAHVGDSRAYRLRGGDFEQLTLDHSLAAGTCRPRLLLCRRGPALDKSQLRDPGTRRRADRRGRSARIRSAAGRHLPAVLRRPAGHG